MNQKSKDILASAGMCPSGVRLAEVGGFAALWPLTCHVTAAISAASERGRAAELSGPCRWGKWRYRPCTRADSH